MPQTRECDYCGDDIPPGTGTMFVRTNGSTIHYCSSKCEKNADLGREPRDVEWIHDEEAEQLRRAEEGEADADEEEEADEEADADTDGEGDEEADADAEEAEQEDAEAETEDAAEADEEETEADA